MACPYREHSVPHAHLSYGQVLIYPKMSAGVSGRTQSPQSHSSTHHLLLHTKGEIWHPRECSMSKGNDSAVPLIVRFSMHQVSYNRSERRDATGMPFPVFTGLHCYPPFLKDNYILHLFRMFLFCNSVGTLFVL